METILKDAVNQVPSLVVLVAFVVLLVKNFTKTMSDISTEFLNYTKVREEKMQASIEKNNSVIERNTEMYGRVVEIVRGLKETKGAV